MKVIGKYLILLLVAILVLSGCGKGGGNSKDATTSKTETSNHKGGVLNVGSKCCTFRNFIIFIKF